MCAIGTLDIFLKQFEIILLVTINTDNIISVLIVADYLLAPWLPTETCAYASLLIKLELIILRLSYCI